jgi:hypothetical protein
VEAQDKQNSKTQRTVPKQIQEKIKVSVILYLVDTFVKKPGHKMGINTFWNVLKDITTSLEPQRKDFEQTKEGGSEAKML